MRTSKLMIAAQVALLVIVLMVLTASCLINHNSSMPTTLGVRFVGEYRVDDGDWQTIDPDSSIPSLRGAVTLRGSFEGVAPDGTVTGALPRGCTVVFMLDHLSAELYRDGERVLVSDSENKHIGSFTCGEHIWGYTIPDDDHIVEIVLKNPHSFGNGNAVNKLLNTLSLKNEIAEKELLEEGTFNRASGFAVILMALVLACIALFSMLLKVRYSTLLWQLAVIVFSAGGYIIMSAPNICLWSNNTLFNTCAVQLSAALYLHSIMFFSVSQLSGVCRRLCTAAALVSCGVFCTLLGLSLFGVILPYDVCAYSTAATVPVCMIFVVCFVRACKNCGTLHKSMCVACIVIMSAAVADAAGMLAGLWESCVVSAAVFALVFIIAIIHSLRFIPRSISRELELQMQVQDSRIAIMLSQIQPHFLYNVLNTIHYLCAKDPLTAQKAICDFSDYLRVNLDSIQRKTPVPFPTELKHLRIYLSLEKMRFDDVLEIEYDITTENFQLPALTIQPLAENAVKHGICQNENGGTVRISTRENRDYYEVTVEDNGVGFDPAQQKQDGKTHIGIQNVRDRVERMSGGTLTIESTPGKGTVATVRIPKN